MNNAINTKPQKQGWKKYKGWIFALIILTILSGLIWYNKPLLTAYYLNARYNNFKPGDKIYAHAYMVTDTGLKSFTIPFLHKLRPLTEDDVNKMDIGPAKKALIEKSFTSANKPYVEATGWGINNDSLCKYKTAFLGTYVKSEILNLKYKGDYLPVILFAIKPNKKAIGKDISRLTYKTPDNYKVDGDGLIYIEAQNANDKETKSFRQLN